MKYKILETTVKGQTLVTKVAFIFGETVIEQDVQHFSPRDEAAVIEAIENRAVSEKAIVDAEANNKEIIAVTAEKLNKEIEVAPLEK